MTSAIPNYLDFMAEKGRHVSEINLGSSELALRVSDALQTITLLQNAQIGILGGDVMSTDAGKLVYALHSWGDEYVYLDWYCNHMPDEVHENYVARSCVLAKEKILHADEVAKRLGKECYIVLVTEKLPPDQT